MELVIYVYAKEAVCAYRIRGHSSADPPRTETENKVYLSVHDLRIREPLILRLVRTDNKWIFLEDSEKIYQIYDGKQPFLGKQIVNYSIYHIKTIHKEQLWLQIYTEVFICSIHEKYSILKQTPITIGKQNTNMITFDNKELVSFNHAIIEHFGSECKVIDISKNGIYVNQSKIKEEQIIHFGDVIDIFGLQIVYLEKVLAISAYMPFLVYGLTVYRQTKYNEIAAGNASENLNDNRSANVPIDFHRAPRALLYIDSEPIELEEPPAQREYSKQPKLLIIGPALTMSIPMLLGFFAAAYSNSIKGQTSNSFMYTGLIVAIASGVIGATWAGMNVRYNNKKQKMEAGRRKSTYEAYVRECDIKIKKQYEQNASAMHSMYPSAKDCCFYSEKSHMLWNRNITHDDFLTYRLGIGDTLFQAAIVIPKDKFSVEIDELKKRPAEVAEKYKMLHNVPICIDLNSHRLIGIIGGGSNSCEASTRRNELMNILAVQIAANHPYTEVKMVFLLKGKVTVDGLDREYLKWFPHVWSEDRRMRYIDFAENNTDEIIYELSRVFRLRLENEQIRINKEEAFVLPHFILFIELYERVDYELIAKYIFSESRGCGLTTILFASAYEELPNKCTYIIQNDSHFSGLYDIHGKSSQRIPISMDIVLPMTVASLARKLAGISISEKLDGEQIPDALTLFELLSIETPEDLSIEKNWLKCRPDMHLKAPIGKKAGGRICYLDVHEKAHGPHGLIAGMTGSGKSELLQTYIISIALQYSPEDVGFFLIDYKGGGMANLFSDLPHVLGSISNLSGSTVQRAMISIKSENIRRQEIFSHCNVNNIYEYAQCYKGGEVIEALPHILIIIDEFAELKKEEPEFMKELISVAQVGRSLGIHLLLATQKPSGTVDEHIRSNARFRLCLRVQDRQDSSDMLSKTDAAYITRAGCAYLQVGNDEIYEMFQTAWSGAIYEEGSKKYTDQAVLIGISGKEEHYTNKKSSISTARECETNDCKYTQLEVVVASIKKAAIHMGGYQKKLLWLPKLPACIYLNTSDNEEMHQLGTSDIAVKIGKYDYPGRQIQDDFYIRLTEGGHHVICGMVTCGKSTFLQTVLYALIKRYTPQQINIYIIDYSSQMLAPFIEAPHVGGFIIENDSDAVKKLFYMLHTILTERKELFQGGNFRQYIKSIDVLPAILLVIDNYAVLKEKTNGNFEDALLEISRMGETYGIYLLITAAGFGGAEISNRMADNFRTSICLEMSDKYQYATVLRVLRTEVYPETGIYGRGLARVDGEILEFQTALALAEQDDYKRMELIKEECCRVALAWGEKNICARKIPKIPEHLTQQVFLSDEKVKKYIENQKYLPIGYYTETAAVCTIDFSKIYCFLITGRNGTGKSNLAKIILCGVIKRDSLVYIIDSEKGKLQVAKQLCEKGKGNRKSIHYYIEPEQVFSLYENLSEEFIRRNKKKEELKKEGKTEEEIYEVMLSEKRYVVFIADFYNWVTMHYKDTVLKGTEALVKNIIEKGSLHNVFFIATYDLNKREEMIGRDIYEYFIKYRTGIHMGGMLEKQKIFDYSSVPYVEQGKSYQAGIGMLPRTEYEGESEYGKVITPLCVM